MARGKLIPVEALKCVSLVRSRKTTVEGSAGLQVQKALERCPKPSTYAPSESQATLLPSAGYGLQQSHSVGFVIHANFCNMRRLLAAFQQQPHLLR